MNDADERRRLSHSVALNHCEPQPPPKLFSFLVEGRAAGNKCPALPTEHSMYATKVPPTQNEMLVARCFQFLSKLIVPSLGFVHSLDSLAQRIEHARHADNY